MQSAGQAALRYARTFGFAAAAQRCRENWHNLQELGGSLSFALEGRIEEETADYWTLASMAELKVLTVRNASEVVRAYRKALTASRRNQ